MTRLTHTYTKPGTYTVQVTDAKGRKGTATFRAATEVLTTLEPATESIGAADFEGHLRGSGFTEESVIVWNGQDEPTRFVDETDIWTTVKPSVVTSPTTLDVAVRNADGTTTPAQRFVWTV